MFYIKDLEKCQAVDLISCDTSTLVDLRSIEIDSSKPVSERVNSFIEQVRNPYLFKVGDIIVKVRYGKEKSFSDALITLLQG